MKILVTAGSTATPIDRVRVISNVFGGRTGRTIAECAAQLGVAVTLLTSEPGVWATAEDSAKSGQLTVRKFKTYDDLAQLMEQEITSGAYDAIIHSAAVSDYRVASIRAEGQDLPAGESALKISSSHPRLFLELVPTAKIVDRIRAPWGFAGKLVKFKLQVGLSDAELIKVAERSRRTSSADIIVANCFEWMREYAYIIGVDGEPQRVSRERLAAELLNQIL